MTDEMLWVELCRDVGMSYEEYVSQPLWFIETHFIRFTTRPRKTKKKQ